MEWLLLALLIALCLGGAGGGGTRLTGDPDVPWVDEDEDA